MISQIEWITCVVGIVMGVEAGGGKVVVAVVASCHNGSQVTMVILGDSCKIRREERR